MLYVLCMSTDRHGQLDIDVYSVLDGMQREESRIGLSKAPVASFSNVAPYFPYNPEDTLADYLDFTLTEAVKNDRFRAPPIIHVRLAVGDPAETPHWSSADFGCYYWSMFRHLPSISTLRPLLRIADYRCIPLTESPIPYAHNNGPLEEFITCIEVNGMPTLLGPIDSVAAYCREDWWSLNFTLYQENGLVKHTSFHFHLNPSEFPQYRKLALGGICLASGTALLVARAVNGDEKPDDSWVLVRFNAVPMQFPRLPGISVSSVPRF